MPDELKWVLKVIGVVIFVVGPTAWIYLSGGMNAQLDSSGLSMFAIFWPLIAIGIVARIALASQHKDHEEEGKVG